MIEVKWIITIIIIMITINYLNQEVPACVDNPVPQETVITNYSTPEVNEINEELQNNLLIFKTSGSSMEPLISDNQRCVCIKSSTYSIGDIVVYFADFGEGFTGVAHQIISIQNETLITKGINNNMSDNPIKREHILCKIATVKKYALLGV